MRPPGGILAPGESLIATGNSFFMVFPHALFYSFLGYFSFPFAINNMLATLDFSELLSENCNLIDSLQVCGTSGDQ